MDHETSNNLNDHRAVLGYVITGVAGAARAVFALWRRHHAPPSILAVHQEATKIRLEHLEQRQTKLEHETRTDLRNLEGRIKDRLDTIIDEKRRMHAENQKTDELILDQLGQQRKVLDDILLTRGGGKHE